MLVRQFRLILSCTLFFLFMFCVFSNAEAEKYPFGFPSAKTNVDNKVPLELLRKLALDDARKTWGEVIPGPEIPCSDIDGNIKAYMFVFRIIKESETRTEVERFGDYSQILSGIIDGRKEHEKAMKNLGELKLDPLSIQIDGVQEEEFASSFNKPQAIALPPEAAEAHQRLAQARMRMWGSDKYGTIVFASTYDQIPVLEKIHGLPYFYSRMDITAQRVKEQLHGNPQLNRIILISALLRYYEFHIDDTRVWANIFSDEVHLAEPEIFEKQRKIAKERRVEPRVKERLDKYRMRWEQRIDLVRGGKDHED